MEITLKATGGELAITGRSVDALLIAEQQPTSRIITDDSGSGQVIQIRQWSPEEAEHYSRTSQTPLVCLHRANLIEMWATPVSRASADRMTDE